MSWRGVGLVLDRDEAVRLNIRRILCLVHPRLPHGVRREIVVVVPSKREVE